LMPTLFLFLGLFQVFFHLVRGSQSLFKLITQKKRKVYSKESKKNLGILPTNSVSFRRCEVPYQLIPYQFIFF
jgi:hypothetical protein